MPLMQMVNIDVQYEEGLSKVFVDEVNRLGKYQIVRPDAKEYYYSTIAEGCKEATKKKADYFLTSFVNITNNKSYLTFYMYDAASASLTWQEELRNIPPQGH